MKEEAKDRLKLIRENLDPVFKSKSDCTRVSGIYGAAKLNGLA